MIIYKSDSDLFAQWSIDLKSAMTLKCHGTYLRHDSCVLLLLLPRMYIKDRIQALNFLGPLQICASARSTCLIPFYGGHGWPPLFSFET